MSPKRLFLLSIVGLAIAGCGFIAFVFVGFAFFTYQGNGMDWIYPVSGLFVMLGVASGFTACVSGVIALREHEEEQNADRPTDQLTQLKLK